MNNEINELSVAGTLTIEQQEKIQKIKNEINLKDSTSVMTYGSSPQKEIAAFSDTVLQKVKMKDSGEVGKTLESLVSKVKEIDVKSLSKKQSGLSKLPLVGNVFNHLEKVKRQFNTVSVEIDAKARELETAKMEITKDIVFLEKMYEKNKILYLDLDMYIKAGEDKIKEIQTYIIPELQAKSENNSDPMAMQELNETVQYINRFEKKIHDLKLTRQIAQQTAPQIVLIREVNEVLADKIQSSIVNTIPMWKQQMSLSLMIDRQRTAAKLQKHVTDTNNELLTNISTMLNQSATEAAIESERSIVDVETLKKTQENFLNTLETVMDIQEEGKQKRKEAEQELIKLETDLKEKLHDIVQRRLN